MSCGLLKELQALIAFACYDLPSVIKRGASLADGAIKDVMTYIFYGVTDPDLITYVDQFKLGLRKFKGLCTQSYRQDQMLVFFWEALLSIPECLYRHKTLLVYFGNGLIEKGMLSHKSLYVSGEKISDRTLLRKKAVMLCTCMKMMALVKSKGSSY